MLELAGKQAGRGSEPTSTMCANAVRVIVDASVDDKVRDEAMKVNNYCSYAIHHLTG